MMGNTTEFFAAAGGLDPAASPDWLVGEDISVFADAAPGIRNMGDPRGDDDPDHYSEFIVTGADNGGVHSNSAIPNHAYYLAVNGGRNAGCDSVGSNGHTHTADCDITVPAVGVAEARQTFTSASRASRRTRTSATRATPRSRRARDGFARTSRTPGQRSA